ncbi:MAG: sodium:solute symporter family protein [Planctomycetes bacterium]|nr:sodium:solute symporter family protein [Planctomycetota bacterium]
MQGSAAVVATVVVYLVVCTVVGLWPSKGARNAVVGYVAGDRSLGLVLMYFITGATIFSAFTFLGMPGQACSQGAASFYILSYGLLGFVPFYFLGPRAARVGRAHGFVTQAEMLAHRFRCPRLALLMALISLIAFVPYIALQIRGAGLIFDIVSGGAIPTWLGAALVYTVVLAYVAKSGLMGVGWTNVLQGVLMLGMAWGLGLYLPIKMYGGVEAMFEAIAQARPEMLVAPGLAKRIAESPQTPWTWSEYSSAVLVSTLGFSCWPHLFMKAFTAKDDRTIRRSVVLYPTFLVFQIPILLMGFAGVLHPRAPSDLNQIVPFLLLDAQVPAVVIGLFCAGALAAAMGGDAIGHAAASIAVRDGVVGGLGIALTPEQQRSWIRWTLVPLLLAAYALAMWWQESLVWLLLFAYGPITQFMPAVVAALYSRRATAAGIVSGLALGIAVTLLFVVRKDLRPWPVHEGLYGLTANVLALITVSALTRRADRSHDERFVELAATRDS